MRITVLIENTTDIPGLATEHGLSLYIESKKRRLLFDTGQSGAFAANAEKLGIDLSLADTAVISHGHYDHGGGIARFFEINSAAPVYASRFAFEPHYNAKGAYIGLDASLEKSGRFVFTDGVTDLGDGLELFSKSTLSESRPVQDCGLTAVSGGIAAPDDFRHEQYLVISEDEKRVVISGCAHAGVANIAAAFRPDVMIGGFHLKSVDDDGILDDTASALLSAGARYYTCHCTGLPQFERMKRLMGGSLSYISTGMSFTV